MSTISSIHWQVVSGYCIVSTGQFVQTKSNHEECGRLVSYNRGTALRERATVKAKAKSIANKLI